MQYAPPALPGTTGASIQRSSKNCAISLPVRGEKRS
jgi:hypothetical protein